MEAGAVYRPEVEIVPHAAPEHPEPATVQSTAVLLVPVTEAVNCWVSVTPTDVLPLGVMLTLMGCGPGPPLLPPPPLHATIIPITTSNNAIASFFITRSSKLISNRSGQNSAVNSCCHHAFAYSNA